MLTLVVLACLGVFALVAGLVLWSLERDFAAWEAWQGEADGD